MRCFLDQGWARTVVCRSKIRVKIGRFIAGSSHERGPPTERAIAPLVPARDGKVQCSANFTSLQKRFFSFDLPRGLYGAHSHLNSQWNWKNKPKKCTEGLQQHWTANDLIRTSYSSSVYLKRHLFTWTGFFCNEIFFPFFNGVFAYRILLALPKKCFVVRNCNQHPFIAVTFKNKMAQDDAPNSGSFNST